MSEFRNAIRSMIDLPPGSLTGEVKAVDKSARLCTVTADGLDIPNVRLRAVSGDGDGMVLLPKVGSTVVIAPLENLDTMYYVAMFSEVDEFLLLVSGMTLRMTAKGLALGNGQESLLKLLQDTVAAMRDICSNTAALTVTCTAPGSPSTPPLNLMQFTNLASSLLQLEKRFGQILDTP